jgi:uncharacterized LabA/DUF88 family protein
MAEHVERVRVAVDVANLWKSCRQLFGEKARLDFHAIATMVPEILGEPVEQRLVAYIATNPKHRYRTLYHAIRAQGFVIHERAMWWDKAGDRPYRTDCDVGLTIDTLHHQDEYDTFVLMSGDGDFDQLLQYLRQHKKRAIVCSFHRSLATTLYRAADRVIKLDQNVVYRTL